MLGIGLSSILFICLFISQPDSIPSRKSMTIQVSNQEDEDEECAEKVKAEDKRTSPQLHKRPINAIPLAA